MELNRDLGMQAFHEILQAIEAGEALPTPRKAKKPETMGGLAWLDELERTPPKFTVDQIIPADSLVAIFGQPKHGKSFVAIDLAACVATGVPYHGRAVEPGFVVYVAGEGRRGVVARFDAWAAHNGVEVRSVALRHGLPLNVEGSAEHVIAEVHAALRERDVGVPALIIIDTLKRNFAGDQNASKDMSVFVRSCDTIREAFPDSSVIVVNHSGHAEKERMGGSIDLLAAVDAEFKVEKKDGKVIVTNTNMKDAEEVEPFGFEFQTYDLSHDRKAAVLIPVEVEAKGKQLSGPEQFAIDSWHAAADAHGVRDGGAFRGVHVDDWRGVFYERYRSDSTSGKRAAFNRAIKMDHLFNMQGDIYLLKGHDVVRHV